jgi:diadenosine tetraphosphate (Ap4A) HIT family hydrolase
MHSPSSTADQFLLGIHSLSAASTYRLLELVRQVRKFLVKEKKIKDCNVVVNCGSAANQTVAHAHIHLLPRYSGVSLPTAAHVWSFMR